MTVACQRSGGLRLCVCVRVCVCLRVRERGREWGAASARFVEVDVLVECNTSRPTNSLRQGNHKGAEGREIADTPQAGGSVEANGGVVAVGAAQKLAAPIATDSDIICGAGEHR